jgi:hypothetical protein
LDTLLKSVYKAFGGGGGAGIWLNNRERKVKSIKIVIPPKKAYLQIFALSFP